MSTQTSFCTLENLLSLETNGSLYCSEKNKTVVTEKVRHITFDWMLSVTKSFNLRKDIWFYAVQLFNVALNKLSDEIDIKKVQLLSVVCLLLASKKLEVCAPEVSDFVRICDGCYEREEILEMEKKVAKALNYNFEMVSICEIIRLYSSLCEVSLEQHTYVTHLCRYYYFGNLIALPSLVVASAHYMASQILNTEFKTEGLKDPVGFKNIFSIPLVNIDVVCKKMQKNVVELNSKYKGFDTVAEKEFVGKLSLSDFLKNVTDFDSVVGVNQKYIEHKYRVSNYIQLVKTPLLENYTKLKESKLGKGTYGSVRKVTIGEKVFALKKTNEEHTCWEGLSSAFIRESSLLQSLNHPNVVKLGYVGCEKLALELMDSDLKTYIDKNPDIIKLPEFQDKCTRQLLDGLSYIHSKGCLIRDIKPQNILIKGIFPDIIVKYCDLGCARGCGLTLQEYNNMTHEVATLWYRPPEILLGAKFYGSKLDVWSLACTLSEVFTGKALFAGDSEIDQMVTIFKVMGTPTEETWSGVTSMSDYSATMVKYEPQKGVFDCHSEKIKRVIEAGLIMDPSKRSTVDDLIKIYELREVVSAPLSLEKVKPTPMQVWNEKFKNAPPHKDKSAILKVINSFINQNIEAQTSPKKLELTVELYEYLSSEEVVELFVKDEKLRYVTAKKLLELKQEAGFKIFIDSVSEKTKEFIYALSGIECM